MKRTRSPSLPGFPPFADVPRTPAATAELRIPSRPLPQVSAGRRAGLPAASPAGRASKRGLSRLG